MVAEVSVEDDARPARGLARYAVAAATALLLAGLGFVAVTAGRTGNGDGSGTPAAGHFPDGHLLIVVAVVLAVTGAGTLLARLLRIPPVIAEVLLCIALGPSLLGALAPHTMQWLFPAGLAPAINGLADVGLVLFMLSAGAELQLGFLLADRRTVLTVAYTALAAPFGIGLLVAGPTFEAFAGDSTPFSSYALLLGCILTVTALPVLARILVDAGIQRTPLASLALGIAGLTDLAVWSVVAVCLGLSGGRRGSPATVVLLAALFVVVMFTAVRPALRWLLTRIEEVEGHDWALGAVIVVGVLCSAVVTDRIGVHLIFGAFVFGAILPRGALRAQVVVGDLARFSVSTLLPLFFLQIGLATNLVLIGSHLANWIACVLFVLVAIGAKLGAVSAAARACRWPWGRAVTLGLLLNCRGVTELILLRIGMSAGIISPALFSILVVMALVTTVMTAPLAGRLSRRTAQQDPPAAAQVSGPVAAGRRSS